MGAAEARPLPRQPEARALRTARVLATAVADVHLPLLFVCAAKLRLLPLSQGTPEVRWVIMGLGTRAHPSTGKHVITACETLHVQSRYQPMAYVSCAQEAEDVVPAACTMLANYRTKHSSVSIFYRGDSLHSFAVGRGVQRQTPLQPLSCSRATQNGRPPTKHRPHTIPGVPEVGTAVKQTARVRGGRRACHSERNAARELCGTIQ